MRILIVNYEFPPIGGGGGIATYYIARELCRKGHSVSVLTSRFRELRWHEELEDIQIYRVPVLRKRRDYCSVLEMATFILSSLPMLFYLLLTRKFDLLHIFFGVPSGPLGYIAKKIFGIPYIIRMGGGDVPGFRPFQYKYLYTMLTPFLNILWRNAEFLVANSDGLRDMAQRVFPGQPIHVIPNGVDLYRFNNRLQRCPTPEVRILFVSRLIRRKGLQFLIDAMPTIRKQAHVPFVIHVVGDGPDKELFTRQIEERGVNEYFRFHGYVDHGKLPDYYLDADLFVLPSLAEGMPNVVLEAMGSGLPIVATKVPGSEELVHDGQNGFLIEHDKPEELIRALVSLINKRSLREKMGCQSKAIAREYGWDRVADDYMELYRNTVRHEVLQPTGEFLHHV